jgi:hypothetical protein
LATAASVERIRAVAAAAAITTATRMPGAAHLAMLRLEAEQREVPHLAVEVATNQVEAIRVRTIKTVHIHMEGRTKALGHGTLGRLLALMAEVRSAPNQQAEIWEPLIFVIRRRGKL